MQVTQAGSKSSWSFGVRDDEIVAKALAEGGPVDGVHNLEDEAALDEFLRYLDVGGFLVEIERLASLMRIERINVTPLRYVMLYIAKIVLGIEGIAQMSPLLLRDEAMMKRMGFNAHEIQVGITQRGGHARGPDTVREGPVSSEAVAENIVKLSALALSSFFNALCVRVIERLALEDAVEAVVDCTDYETTDKYQGAGKVKRERPVKVKGSGRPKKMEVMVFGWKVAVLYHARMGLPLSVCVAPIQRSDNHIFWNVVDDAEKNLAKCGKRLASVAMDRGFLDGADLWRLDQRNITFVIPAKKNMLVYSEALTSATADLGVDSGIEVTPEVWHDEVNRGYGKDRRTDSLLTSVVGVSGLTTMDTYGPEGHANVANSKGFKPNSINAVVVTTWRGRTFDKPVVFLTNGSVLRPRRTFNRYDDRSLIENGLFREGKQSWSFQSPPQKNEAGVMAHIYLTLGTLLLTRCYRLEKERETARRTKASSRPTPTPLATGMERYRQQLKIDNQDKVIIFQGDRYAIMHVQEMALLSGVNLRERSQGVGTREETFEKYGMEPPPPPPPVRVIASKSKRRRKPKPTPDWLDD